MKHRLSLARERVGAWLQLMYGPVYGPELAALSMNERNRLLFALEALTDPDRWAQMRDSGMSFTEACEAWISAVDRDVAVHSRSSPAQLTVPQVEHSRG